MFLVDAPFIAVFRIECVAQRRLKMSCVVWSTPQGGGEVMANTAIYTQRTAISEDQEYVNAYYEVKIKNT